MTGVYLAFARPVATLLAATAHFFACAFWTAAFRNVSPDAFEVDEKDLHRRKGEFDIRRATAQSFLLGIAQVAVFGAVYEMSAQVVPLSDNAWVTVMLLSPALVLQSLGILNCYIWERRTLTYCFIIAGNNWFTSTVSVFAYHTAKQLLY